MPATIDRPSGDDDRSRKDVEACRDQILQNVSRMNAKQAKEYYEKLKKSGPWGSGKEQKDWLQSRQFAAIGFEVMLKLQSPEQ